MAITGTPYMPGSTGAEWVDEVWTKEIDRQAYFKAVLLPLITKKEPLHGALHIPKHDNLTPAIITATTDMSGHGLTFSANTETEFTNTPQTLSLNVSVNDNQLDRMATDPDDMLKTSIEMAMAFYIDTSIATLFASFTSNIVGNYGADIDKSGATEALSLLMNGAKEFSEAERYFAYHVLQHDAVMSTGDFTQVYARGGKETPQVTGKVAEAYGWIFKPCGAIRNSGGGFNNAGFVKRSMVASFNSNPNISIERQRFGRANWLLGYSDYMVGTVRESYNVLYRSLPS